MIYVFTGPTLNSEEASRYLDANYLPPVSQGDVYRVALTDPVAIAIIDGYFDQVPAVWHKELLWALSRGIKVFGGASMGALRAAELAVFGMHGIGKVFDWYRTGVIEADDEVAVLHAPAEYGYRQISEALVNIRATLAKALDTGVIDPDVADTMLKAARGLFFPDRNYPLIIQRTIDSGVPQSKLHGFSDWWNSGRVDQKRLDAIELLDSVKLSTDQANNQRSPTFVFEDTTLWRELIASVRGRNPAKPELADRWEELLDRLEGGDPEVAKQLDASMFRLLLLEESVRQGYRTTEESIVNAATRFRSERALINKQDMDRWALEHDLDNNGVLRLLDEEARIRCVKSLLRNEALSTFENTLRISGTYKSLPTR